MSMSVFEGDTLFYPRGTDFEGYRQLKESEREFLTHVWVPETYCITLAPISNPLQIGRRTWVSFDAPVDLDSYPMLISESAMSLILESIPDTTKDIIFFVASALTDDDNLRELMIFGGPNVAIPNDTTILGKEFNFRRYAHQNEASV